MKLLTHVKMTYRIMMNKHLPLVTICPQMNLLKMSQKYIRYRWKYTNYKVQKDLEISECYIKIVDPCQNDMLNFTA